jgi:hypothetical protein
MDIINNLQLRDVCIVLGVSGVAIVAGAIALLVMAAQSVRDIQIPEDADFFETMQLIPITIPIALDLLDLVLDVFSAPIAWIVLDMLGLGALKMITVIESIIPGTQLIPTMTVAWIVSRTLIKDRTSGFRTAMHQYQLKSRNTVPILGQGRGAGSRADYYRGLALPPGEENEEAIPARRARGSTFGGLSPLGGEEEPIEGEILDEGDFPGGGRVRPSGGGYEDSGDEYDNQGY